MSARTYICVPCRWARRAEAAFGLHTDLRCPTCQGGLWELSRRWRIPRKANDKEWKALGEKVVIDAANWLPQRRAIGTARLAKVDEQIAKFERYRDSPAKSLNLKKLRAERESIAGHYF